MRQLKKIILVFILGTLLISLINVYAVGVADNNIIKLNSDSNVIKLNSEEDSDFNFIEIFDAFFNLFKSKNKVTGSAVEDKESFKLIPMSSDEETGKSEGSVVDSSQSIEDSDSSFSSDTYSSKSSRKSSKSHSSSDSSSSSSIISNSEEKLDFDFNQTINENQTEQNITSKWLHNCQPNSCNINNYESNEGPGAPDCCDKSGAGGYEECFDDNALFKKSTAHAFCIGFPEKTGTDYCDSDGNTLHEAYINCEFWTCDDIQWKTKDCRDFNWCTDWEYYCTSTEVKQKRRCFGKGCEDGACKTVVDEWQYQTVSKKGDSSYCSKRKEGVDNSWAYCTLCGHGDWDCDSNSECSGSLVCKGPVGGTLDGCCNSDETWDTNTYTCKRPPDCSSGVCCDDDGYFSPSSYVCDSHYGSYYYSCMMGNCLDKEVYKKDKKRYCSGNSASCSGNIEWNNPVYAELCSSTEYCDGTTDSWTSSVISCSQATCTSGDCCDASCGVYDYKDAGTKCWEITHYGCPWGNNPGNDVGERLLNSYCSGTKNYCDGEIIYNPWSLFDDCTINEYCENPEFPVNKFWCKEIVSECAGTDTSCGIYPNCNNCNSNDACSGDYYRNYYCLSNSAGCSYTSDSCSDCSCSCGGYNTGETTANGNCADGKDNDCDGLSDGSDPGCFEDWTPYGDNEYKIVNGNFVSAQSTCQGYSGTTHLATVNDDAENTWLIDTFGDAAHTEGLGVGYNDRETEGNFEWTYGASSYTKWYPGEPSGGENDEDCTRIGTFWGYWWLDDNCDSNWNYVCEKEGGSACFQNSDCGVNGWTGSSTCSGDDVFQNWRDYTCNNPGQTNAYCSHTDTSKKKQDCGVDSCGSFGNSYCKDNDVYHSRTCNDKGCSGGSCFNTPYTDEKKKQECGVSGCTNGKCNICYQDSDCGTNGYVGSTSCSQNDVYQNYRTYKCNNPGQTSSTCTYSDELKKKIECGEDSCGSWSYYCSGNNVYRKKECHDKGCSGGACFDNNIIQQEFVENCYYGCENGGCKISVRVDLKTGKNWFSLPVNTQKSFNQLNSNCQVLSSVADDLCPGIELAYYEKGGTDTTAYTCIGLSTALQPGKGYYAAVSGNCYFNIVGGEITENSLPGLVGQLKQNWNLIGAGSEDILFSDILGTCSISSGVWGLEGNNKFISSWLNPGKGYMVKVDGTCELG